jgi:hypothetical protein
MIGKIPQDFGLPARAWTNPVHRFRSLGTVSYDRPKGIIEAQLKMDSWREGSPATVAFERIPGMALFKVKSYERGHLLARRLGGRGDTDNNLTPVSRAANPGIRDYTEKVVAENWMPPVGIGHGRLGQNVPVSTKVQAG